MGTEACSRLLTAVEVAAKHARSIVFALNLGGAFVLLGAVGVVEDADVFAVAEGRHAGDRVDLAYLQLALEVARVGPQQSDHRPDVVGQRENLLRHIQQSDMPLVGASDRIVHGRNGYSLSDGIASHTFPPLPCSVERCALLPTRDGAVVMQTDHVALVWTEVAGGAEAPLDPRQALVDRFPHYRPPAPVSPSDIDFEQLRRNASELERELAQGFTFHAREFKFPVIGVEVRARQFLALAPWLLFLMAGYLQLCLGTLRRRLAALDEVARDLPLRDYLFPWLGLEVRYGSSRWVAFVVGLMVNWFTSLVLGVLAVASIYWCSAHHSMSFASPILACVLLSGLIFRASPSRARWLGRLAPPARATGSTETRRCVGS